MRPQDDLIVVAGEASGDEMAARVVAALGRSAFGAGGARLNAAGVEVLVDTVASAAMMGLGDLRSATVLAHAALRLLHEARRRRPRAALLVGFSEFNARLGPRLRRLGARVLWYAPPQIWAWRPERGRRLLHAADRLAVLLPFEEPLWRGLGADARYVGHPALETALMERASARARLGLGPGRAVALLPGSREEEVLRHLRPMLAAVRLLRARAPETEARLLLAASLHPETARRARELARHHEVATLHAGAAAAELLPAFDAAGVASGTACLECATAGVPPVVVYRTGALRWRVARRLVRIPCIALPNIVLGRRAFPELLQDAVTPANIARALADALNRRDELLQHCTAVRDRLVLEDRTGAATAGVCAMIAPWLEPSALVR